MAVSKKKRNVGEEIIQGLKELAAGKTGRITVFDSEKPPANKRAVLKRKAR